MCNQPNGGGFAKVATACFKWQLKGDKKADQLFTGNPPELSKMPGWSFDKKKMP